MRERPKKDMVVAKDKEDSRARSTAKAQVNEEGKNTILENIRKIEEAQERRRTEGARWAESRQKL